MHREVSAVIIRAANDAIAWRSPRFLVPPRSWLSIVLVSLVLCSLTACSDPPTDGSLRIDIGRLMTRAGWSQLGFTVAKVELFYDAAPAAAGEDGGDCTFAGATTLKTDPATVAIDLTQTGSTFLGAFFAPPGHVDEIRLVVQDTNATVQGLVRRAHLSTRCAGGDTNGLLRLIPLPGESVDIQKGKTTDVEVQFDPNRDIVVDGQGGDYGQSGGPNNPPGSCGTGQPCGKPFKLASDYGIKVVAPPTTQQVYTDRVVVGFNAGVTQATIETINAGIGASVIQSDRRTGYFVLQLPSSTSVHDAIDYYSGKGEVNFALPDTVVYLEQSAPDGGVIPCNSDFQNPGPFTQVGAPIAWSTTTGSRQTILAVVDSAFDLADPSLVNQFFLNQGELMGTPGVLYFDKNSDGTVTASEVQSFDVNGDGIVDFVDLNSPTLKCLCASATGGPMPKSCTSSCSGHPEYSTCDIDCDGIVSPLDIVDGNCPMGVCIANSKWQDGIDNDGNQRIDDLVGWDFQNNDNQPQTDPGNRLTCGPHGAGVAGVMAAIGAPQPAMGMACGGGPVAGMDWNTRLIPIENGFQPRTQDEINQAGKMQNSSRGTAYIGISYAAALGADVVNCSFGVSFIKGTDSGNPQAIIGIGDKFDALKKAIQKEQMSLSLGKTVVVTAAGNYEQNNDDPDIIKWPGANLGNANIIEVGGVDASNNVATFTNCGAGCASSYGPMTVAIAAPATGFTVLNSTNIGDGPAGPRVWKGCEGTSYAAPMVSGTIGLMIAADPQLQGNAAQVIGRLLCNATAVPSLVGAFSGGRVLNAAAAVNNANGCSQ